MLAYFDLDKVTNALQPLLVASEPGRFLIDLRAVQFISPAGMALLRCAMKRCQELRYFGRDSRVILPHAENVRTYLRRMDVLDGIVRFTTEDDRGRRAPTGFVPMEKFEDEDQAGRAAVRIVESFRLETSVAKRTLENNLCEITENAVYHSGIREGFACAQSWNRRMIEFAIADHGMGIVRSMRQNPRHASLSDRDALEAALELGGTGVDSLRRGQGLWMVSQAVERNGGSMTIRSGPVVYSQEGARRSFRTPAQPLPGTLVAMRFNLGAALDMADILESAPHDDDGFFISFED